MRMPKLALKDKGWWYDIREYRYAVLVWAMLNLLDFGLTRVGLSHAVGGYELNVFLRYLSPLAFAWQKFFLTMASITVLATWRWLWFLKWLNWIWVALACWNIYQLMRF